MAAKKIHGVTNGIYGRLIADQEVYWDFLVWLFDQNASWKLIVARLKERGIVTSDGALSSLRSRHSTALRLDYARIRAERELADLPENAPELTRKALQKKFFEAAFTQVTTDELVQLDKAALAREKFALERERLALDREKFELAKAREAKTREVLGDRKLSAEEKNNRLKEVFGIQ